MQVYLAGRYSKKLELRKYADELEKVGIRVGTEWLKEPDNPNGALSDSSESKLAEYARQDYWNIGACDVFVFFAENQDFQPPRGGRHVEFGMALILGKPIVVVGSPENIFHYLPGFHIGHFENWNSAKTFLQVMDKDWKNSLDGLET